MSLTDAQILELNALCNALVDETITPEQRDRLAQWLLRSEEARRFYVRAMALSADLCSYAAELQTEAAEPRPAPGLLRRGRAAFWWGWFGPLAAAACVLGLFWWAGWLHHGPAPVHPAAAESVARLTGSKDCRWADAASTPRPGDYLWPGQRLRLSTGFAEITFDSGAQVVIEGPALVEINSAWDATLLNGTLRVSAPPEAIGFRINNPTVDVVDLGTEFTMIADASGAAEVLVLKGEVEVASSRAGEQTYVLRENESKRFAASGISEIRDREQKFAHFSRPAPLEIFSPATRYVRWSFDEPGGIVIGADDYQVELEDFTGRLNGLDPTSEGPSRTAGRWKRALPFDGRIFAKARFPGLSGSTAHTVMFWVRVPPDTQLSDAYAMVAWGLNFKEYGVHPVHVCWNRNPLEGPVGALRTDFLGGFAMGATPLRDGRWHHVAVVFVPGKDPDSLPQVKQYVDGRLETSASTRGVRRQIWADADPGQAAGVLDTLWLGCRLGSDRERRGRFRGELDELVIADGALSPQQILQVMKHNAPLGTQPAATAARN